MRIAELYMAKNRPEYGKNYNNVNVMRFAGSRTRYLEFRGTITTLSGNR